MWIVTIELALPVRALQRQMGRAGFALGKRGQEEQGREEEVSWEEGKAQGIGPCAGVESETGNDYTAVEFDQLAAVLNVRPDQIIDLVIIFVSVKIDTS